MLLLNLPLQSRSRNFESHSPHPTRTSLQVRISREHTTNKSKQTHAHTHVTCQRSAKQSPPTPSCQLFERAALWTPRRATVLIAHNAHISTTPATTKRAAAQIHVPSVKPDRRIAVAFSHNTPKRLAFSLTPSSQPRACFGVGVATVVVVLVSTELLEGRALPTLAAPGLLWRRGGEASHEATSERWRGWVIGGPEWTLRLTTTRRTFAAIHLLRGGLGGGWGRWGRRSELRRIRDATTPKQPQPPRA